MNLKKFILTAFIIPIFFITGCSNSEGDGIENQQTDKYKIGIVQYADHTTLEDCKTGFIEGLSNEGFISGGNLEIIQKSAQGDSSLNTQIVQNFVNSKVNLVFGIATPSAMTAYNYCYENKIPVVFGAVSDPIKANLAKSKTEPMDGITGVSDQPPVDKQLELIRKILPDAKKIGIIYTTNESNSQSTLNIYKEKAGDFGFEIIEKGISNASEISQAIDVVLGQVDCISNLTDNIVVNNLPVMLEKANAANIPIFGSESRQVAGGCLASAGVDYIELGKKAGIMASKILKGEEISTIPYEVINQSEIAVNEETASKLNIIIPNEILENAEKSN